MKPPTRPVFNLKPTTRGARFSRVASNRGRLRGLVEGTVCKKLFYTMKYDIWYNIYILCIWSNFSIGFNDKWSRNQSTNLVSQYPLSCCEIMITSGERRLSGFSESFTAKHLREGAKAKNHFAHGRHWVNRQYALQFSTRRMTPLRLEMAIYSP